MAKDSDALVLGIGNDRQWVGTFQLKDKSGNVMFSVDQSGAVTAAGAISAASSADNNGNISITNTAPFLLFADSTASAKQLKIKCDADKAQLRETGGADGSLLVLDLTNARVGIATASPSVPLDVTGAAAISGALTLGSSLFQTNIDAALTALSGGGQDSAATSSKAIAVVTTVAAGNDSFTLPAATGSGRTIKVSNQAAANSMQLFGLGTDTVNAATNTVGVAVTTKKTATCVDYASGKWFAGIA